MRNLLTFIPIALLAGCGQPQINLDDEKQNIISCWKDWEIKAKAGDPTHYWTDDLMIMGAGGTGD